jgi:tagatose-1,6-bisphosphate aldolase non-catalytic subunit AgaZ/GatZ
MCATSLLETVREKFAIIRVLGPKKDIMEVRNAIFAYESIDQFKSDRLQSLLKAHKLLMNGQFRWIGLERIRHGPAKK